MIQKKANIEDVNTAFDLKADKTDIDMLLDRINQV